MVYVSKSTPYMQHFMPFLDRKHRLAIDAWGADESKIKHVFQPIVDLLEAAVPNEEHQKLYPYPVWTLEGRVHRLARTMLVAEFMVMEWAEYFRGMDETKLEEIASSFRFENCEMREGLNAALREHAAFVKD